MEPVLPYSSLITHHSSLFTSPSHLHPVDYAYPVFWSQASRGKFADNLKHLVRKSADVQDVRAFPGLGRPVWLDIYTDKPPIRISLLELIPFGHCGGSPATPCIYPRLVVRYEDDQVAPRILLVQQPQRSTAIGPAAAHGGELRGILHYSLAPVQPQADHIILERQNFSLPIAPKH